jgi:hypothetical protein
MKSMMDVTAVSWPGHGRAATITRTRAIVRSVGIGKCLAAWQDIRAISTREKYASSKLSPAPKGITSEMSYQFFG